MTKKKKKLAAVLPLIKRKYYIGPYSKPLFVVFKYYKPRRMKISFTAGDVSVEELCKDDCSVFKLPAGYTCVVTVCEVADGRFIFEVQQFPAAAVPADTRYLSSSAQKNSGDDDPPIPVGNCSDDCDPYTIECAAGDPYCVADRLVCRLSPPAAADEDYDEGNDTERVSE